MSWTEQSVLLPVVRKLAILSQVLSDWQTRVLKSLGLVQNVGKAGHRGGAWKRQDVKWKKSEGGRTRSHTRQGRKVCVCVCVCVGGMGAVSGRVLNNRADKGFLKRPVHPERGLVGSAKADFGSWTQEKTDKPHFTDGYSEEGVSNKVPQLLSNTV